MMEFKELAEKVTTATATVCHSDFSWLLIRQNDEYSVPAAFNIGSREARELGFVLLGETAPDRRAVTVFRDKKLKIRIQNDVLNFSFSSLVIAPLRVKDRTTGYLFMAIKKDLTFEDEDILTIEAFANSAAMALENARVLETRLEKERLLKELEVARVIQRRLLPQSVPRVAWAEIAAFFAPAYEVGGDYYDFFLGGDRCLRFVIADVAGKGLAAAFVMAEVKGSLSLWPAWSRIPASCWSGPTAFCGKAWKGPGSCPPAIAWLTAGDGPAGGPCRSHALLSGFRRQDRSLCAAGAGPGCRR